MSRWLLVLALASIPAPQAGAEGCSLKLVFGKYCLGGPEAALPDGAQRQGGYYMYSGEAGATVSVSAYEGNVVAVGELHPRPSWIAVRRIESTLTEIYGKPKDRSQYPGYADTDDSRALAISVEKGVFKKIWPQEGFDITLLWGNSTTFSVIYSTPGLQRMLKEDARGRY